MGRHRSNITTITTKPSPPYNLWSELDKIVSQNMRPVDSFTTKEFSERYKVTYSVAEVMIDRLVREGKVERLGKFAYGGRLIKCYGFKKGNKHGNNAG